MPRLRNTLTGVTVNVSDDHAERLAARNYVAAEESKSAPKKAAAKSDSK